MLKHLISHPKQVYMFKNLIEIMESRGHEFEVVVVEKEIVVVAERALIQKDATAQMNSIDGTAISEKRSQ